MAGFVPRERSPDFLRTITLVMGQKQQLLWDLPPAETYAMNRALFDIPRAEADATLGELVELLEIGPLIGKPTRQLSLGERMKCELAAALLHRPRVLFLDEPTIGLDVSMQARMRQFIRDYNERHGATVILTSHYMEDVAALCPRIIVIDKGHLVYDGDLRELARRIRPEKRITVRLLSPRQPRGAGPGGQGGQELGHRGGAGRPHRAAQRGPARPAGRPALDRPVGRRSPAGRGHARGVPAGPPGGRRCPGPPRDPPAQP